MDTVETPTPPPPTPPEPPVLRLWRPYDPIEFKVRCERRLHRIRIDGAGRLVLVDHDMEMEAFARALGGDEMRCPAVVGRFKTAITSGLVGALPDKARPHVHATQARKHDRRTLKSERHNLTWGGPLLASGAAADDVPAQTWAGQRSKEAYLNRYVRRLLARSRLAAAAPQGADPYATPHAVQISVAACETPPTELHLDVYGRQGFGPRTALRGTVWIAQHWWRRVHAAGMDLIDGRLVLDAPALADDQGVLYSFAGMTPRARRRARRKQDGAPAQAPAQLPLPDILGQTRTATVCVLSDPLPAAYPSDRWRLRLETRWFEAVAERGAPWRLEKPVESWRIPRT